MTPLETLQRSPLFRDLTETGLRIFAGMARERTLAAGAPLFLENTAGESLFIIRTGTVRITQRVAGAERELALLGPGEHLGAVSLLGRSVRLVTAVAATPCEVLELTQPDFVALQPEKPQACLKVAVAIAVDLATRVAENRDVLRELPATTR